MKIESYEAGRCMRIDGKSFQNDLKIIDGRIAADWWRKQGHSLDEADIADILAARPEILVIGTGYAENMRVPEPTSSLLFRHGIRVIAQNTSDAVKTYNRLAQEGRKVAGAFHLTC